MNDDLVTIDVIDGVADVRLNRLIASPNQVEAITANFENREPNFTDPE